MTWLSRLDEDDSWKPLRDVQLGGGPLKPGIGMLRKEGIVDISANTAPHCDLYTDNGGEDGWTGEQMYGSRTHAS